LIELQLGKVLWQLEYTEMEENNDEIAKIQKKPRKKNFVAFRGLQHTEKLEFSLSKIEEMRLSHSEQGSFVWKVGHFGVVIHLIIVVEQHNVEDDEQSYEGRVSKLEECRMPSLMALG